MSFTEQQLSEGIRTSHEFSNSKRRLKRKRDERDSSRQVINRFFTSTITDAIIVAAAIAIVVAAKVTINVTHSITTSTQLSSLFWFVNKGNHYLYLLVPFYWKNAISTLKFNCNLKSWKSLPRHKRHSQSFWLIFDWTNWALPLVSHCEYSCSDTLRTKVSFDINHVTVF